MNRLMILITRRECHPNFGGETTKTFEYGIREGHKAETKYLELAEDDASGYCYTTIQIVLKEVKDEN